MKALYVSTPNALDGTIVLADLLRLDPALELESVIGAAAALVEVRTARDYRVLFLSPSVPRNEALALISTLRRDRVPIVIVAIVTDDDRGFFAPAVTAGADDVVVFRERHLVTAEDTLRRIHQNRHLEPEAGQVPLRVLYAGQDDLAWDLVSTIHFVHAGRTTPDTDGVVSLNWDLSETPGDRCDVLIVDEAPGAAHALQVVKWAKAHHPDIPLVVLTPATAGDVGGAALELGADEIVSKAGNYRRRLLATLHRLFVRRALHASHQTAEADRPLAPPPAAVMGAQPPIAVTADRDEIERLRTTLDEAETRFADQLVELEASREARLELQAAHDRLAEAQAFERALRTRDREELAALSRELHEERERRVVLEGTLRQTEGKLQTELSAMREAHEAERRQLEEEVAKAADRLHEVAHATQVLQARLELQLAERAAERDRLMDNALVGYASFTREGHLVRCSPTFAEMLGYASADDAVEGQAGVVFPGTPDHARVVAALNHPATSSGTGRIESTVRRVDGRPVRVLTSAVLIPAVRTGAADDLVERLFVDLTDRARAETELRLARRLESAGRLAAEMAPQIESTLDGSEGGNDAERERSVLLVRQLLAFSRLQAKPAGYLSLNDAITRSGGLLRQLAGDAVDLQLRLGDIEPVAAGEDDIEHLVIELVSTMAGCLPFGGRLTITTATETDPTFVLRTLLSASAAGYGVLPVHLSSSLARLVARCGGVVQVSGDAGRTSMLHVLLPC